MTKRRYTTGSKDQRYKIAKKVREWMCAVADLDISGTTMEDSEEEDEFDECCSQCLTSGERLYCCSALLCSRTCCQTCYGNGRTPSRYYCVACKPHNEEWDNGEL
jgi:hypothetical protein